jgi:hypothetical protein
MLRIFGIAGSIFIALLIAASSAFGSYVLRHPAHERCPSNYVRTTRTVKSHGHHVSQVWCVRSPKREAPAGSKEWLLAHTSVARATEVLVQQSAKNFPEIREMEEANHATESPKWVQSPPACVTGIEHEYSYEYEASYLTAYIKCLETAEIQFQMPEQRTREIPCTPEQQENGDDGCYPGGSTTESYIELVPESKKYRAILDVYQYNQDHFVCGHFEMYEFLGAEWESLAISGPTCNVEME